MLQAHAPALQQRPELDDILSSSRPTLKHIPKNCRGLWSTALAQACATAHLATTALGAGGGAAVMERCVTAWVDVLMLPKATLTPSARSGRRHHKLTGQHTRARLQRWLNGERAQLWEDSTPKKTARTGPPNNRATCRRRALDLVEEDRLGAAAAALNSQGVASNSTATLAALRAKHPRGPAPPQDAAPQNTGSPTLTPDEVLNALISFPKGSAPGPSGLRPQHLLDGVRGPDQRVALEALADAVNTLAFGRVPHCLAPAIAGASLHALQKPDGDVRPIAVGETLRRLTSKCLCAVTKDEAAAYLRPLQVGVACSLGAEAVIRTIDQYSRRHADSPGKLILKVDFANAFNTINREPFLRACATVAPAAAKWAWWCYAQTTTLLFNGAKINSETGVQQGDNLGPLLFALALQPILLQLQALRIAGRGLDIVVAYLDDLVIAGDDNLVLGAFRLLQNTAPLIGLQLKLSKCEIIPTAGHGSTASLADFPAEIQRKRNGFFDILGAPVGDAAHCQEYIRKKRILDIEEKFNELAELGDSHAAYKILSRCMGSCKMMYAMRTTRPDCAVAVFSDFDILTRSALERAFGTALPDLAWRQAMLSTSEGGLGVRSAALHAPAAFLASTFHTWPLCQEIDPSHVWEGAWAGSGVSAAAQMLNRCLPAEDAVDCTEPPTMASTPEQSELSRAIDKQEFHSLLAALQLTHRARLQAAAAPHAGAWLHAPACQAFNLRLTSAEFTTAALFRLGAPLLPNDTWCPKCDQVLDRAATHAVVCGAGGDGTARHNALRDECHFRCLAVGFQAEKEQPGLLQDDPRRRPGDIFLPAWPGGAAVALDFAVTCPLQANTRQAAADRPLVAAMAYEAAKLADRDTAARCVAQGIKLIPMVVETFGGWGPAARAVLGTLAHTTAQSTGIPHSIATCQLYEALGVRLQRANARAIISRLAASAAARDNTTLAATSRAEAALVLSSAARENS